MTKMDKALVSIAKFMHRPRLKRIAEAKALDVKRDKAEKAYDRLLRMIDKTDVHPFIKSHQREMAADQWVRKTVKLDAQRRKIRI